MSEQLNVQMRAETSTTIHRCDECESMIEPNVRHYRVDIPTPPSTKRLCPICGEVLQSFWRAQDWVYSKMHELQATHGGVNAIGKVLAAIVAEQEAESYLLESQSACDGSQRRRQELLERAQKLRRAWVAQFFGNDPRPKARA